MMAAVSGSVRAATNADAATITTAVTDAAAVATTTAAVATGSGHHLLLQGRYFSSLVQISFEIDRSQHFNLTLRFNHSSASSLGHRLPSEHSYYSSANSSEYGLHSPN